MYVKKRHDVQTAVLGSERKRRDDVPGGGRGVAMQKRHDLRPRGRSRRVQDQRNVIGARCAVSSLRLGCVKRESASWSAGLDFQADGDQAKLLGRGQSRTIVILGNDDGLCRKVLEIEANSSLRYAGLSGAVPAASATVM